MGGGCLIPFPQTKRMNNCCANLSRRIASPKVLFDWSLITGRNEVVAKVMFLQVCVCPQGGRVSASVHAGMPSPPGPGRSPLDGEPPPGPGRPPQMEPPRMENSPVGWRPPGKQTPAYGLRVAGMHPTGMHSSGFPLFRTDKIP